MDASLVSRTRQDHLWTHHALDTLKHVLDVLPAVDPPVHAKPPPHVKPTGEAKGDALSRV